MAQTVRLLDIFTPEQLDVLTAAMECWVEEYETATNEVIRDRTLDTPEQLLDAVSGMQDDFNSGVTALEILRSARQEVVT